MIYILFNVYNTLYSSSVDIINYNNIVYVSAMNVVYMSCILFVTRFGLYDVSVTCIYRFFVIILQQLDCVNLKWNNTRFSQSTLFSFAILNHSSSYTVEKIGRVSQIVIVALVYI